MYSFFVLSCKPDLECGIFDVFLLDLNVTRYDFIDNHCFIIRIKDIIESYSWTHDSNGILTKSMNIINPVFVTCVSMSDYSCCSRFHTIDW